MLPGAEALGPVADAGPSLAGAALRLGLAAAAMVAAAAGWLWWQRRVRGPARLLEVVDRAALTRGASVAVVRIGERRLLLGVSNDGVRLLREIDEPTTVPDRTRRRFPELLAEAASGARPRP